MSPTQVCSKVCTPSPFAVLVPLSVQLIGNPTLQRSHFVDDSCCILITMLQLLAVLCMSDWYTPLHYCPNQHCSGRVGISLFAQDLLSGSFSPPYPPRHSPL